MCYIRTDAIGSFRNFTTKLEEKQTERIDQNVNFDKMQYLYSHLINIVRGLGYLCLGRGGGRGQCLIKIKI